MMTGCSPGVLNIFWIFSCAGLLIIIFSLGNDRCISSKSPIVDTDNVLSVLYFPPMRLVLACNALVLFSAIPHTMTMVFACTFAVSPWSIACTLYIPGIVNVWVTCLPSACAPSPKFRRIF